MTEQEILEGNRLIAEFMGYTVYKKRYPRNHGIGAPEAEYKDCILEKTKYHSDWNELMKVVEEIEQTGYGVTIGMRSAIDIQTDEGCFNVRAGAIKPKIENLYTCIIQWIKWYNTITK